jgi:hypothetical protein
MKLNLLLLSAAAALANTATAATAEPKVNLGSADKFVILAKSGISTEPLSEITGNIGVSPIAATAITGFSLIADSENRFSTSAQIADGDGAYAADYAVPTPETLTTAVLDMEAAYSDASKRSNNDDDRKNLGEDGDISGFTLTPGVYTFDGDIKFNGTIYFKGNANDVFIVQTTGSILQADDTEVILNDDNSNVKAKNIFWQVAGHVTVGAGSKMQGTLLVKEKALFETGSSLDGRVFAQTACDLQQARITEA